jgi:hypothetical protein
MIDTEGPAIAASVSEALLWPANHDLVNVGLAFSAADNGCGATATTVAVFSDEPDVFNDGGDNFSPDAKDIAAGTLRLRAVGPRTCADNRGGATSGGTPVSVHCLAAASARAFTSLTAPALLLAGTTTARHFVARNGVPSRGDRCGQDET